MNKQSIDNPNYEHEQQRLSPEMTGTDLLRELAKEAKKHGNQPLVMMYFRNLRRIKRKERLAAGTVGAQG